MDQFLTDADVRVLGALIEKQVTTPDNYPLSLNALVAACNQSSNRHPVVTYDEETVLGAIQRLRRASLVRGIQRIDSRVTKYEHVTADVLNLASNEVAIMCVLMLRGPNTLGELRTRTERLGKFESLAELETTLNGLIQREKDPLVVRLARKPGQKEARYAHLLSGEIAVNSDEATSIAAPAPQHRDNNHVDDRDNGQNNDHNNNHHNNQNDERIAALEETVTELKAEVSDIRQQLEEFRKQFE